MKKTENTIENFMLTSDNYKRLLTYETMKPCERFILSTIIERQHVSLNPVFIDYTEISRFVSVSSKTVSKSINQLQARGLINILVYIDGRLEYIKEVDDRYEMIYCSLELDMLDMENLITLDY